MAKPRDYEMVFTGAGEREVQAIGKYLRVLDTPTAEVYFSLDDGAELLRGAGQQIADSDPQGFQRVKVRSTVAQTVRFTVAETPQDDDRTNLALTVGATVAGSTAATKAGAVTVPPAGSIQLIGANADRQEVRLGIASDQPGGVWFSDDPGQGDQEGGFLDAGMVDYVATLAALWAYNPHPTDAVVVNVLDMESP